MNEMVERVARRICGMNCWKAEFFGSDHLCGPHTGQVPCEATLEQLFVVGFIDRAILCIKDMREPTEAMICEGGTWFELPEGSAKEQGADCWRAMVDEALK